MPTTITIRNPSNPNETWTSGNRGKPPKFVTTHPDYIAYKGQKSLEVPSVAQVVVSDTTLKYWKWIGLENFEAQHHCYVAAPSRVEAIRELNKSFQSPVGSLEMDVMWSQIQPEEGMVQAVGTYELKEKSWQKR